MSETEEKKSIGDTKAKVLRDAVSKKKEQPNGEKSAMPPMISALLSKLGFLGSGSPCGSGSGSVVIVAKKATPTAPNIDEPSGTRKVLEKEKTESQSPFMKKCLAAITGKEECC